MSLEMVLEVEANILQDRIATCICLSAERCHQLLMATKLLDCLMLGPTGIEADQPVLLPLQHIPRSGPGP